MELFAFLSSRLLSKEEEEVEEY